MPLSWEGPAAVFPSEAPYFVSLKELDSWALTSARKLDGILPYRDRATSSEHPNINGTKLLVCHDYKGGYTERPDTVSYTFNFWSRCDTFVYFSHYRVTVPPPGWINAAHRQGVKILGVLIFESGAEEDCLRLLVGNLPPSLTGPAKHSAPSSSLPLSPHYARLLADLAQQRGFDGYLLNFECPLQGGIEQTRTLAAWIAILEAELKATVGSHAEALWYDSVIVTGKLRWQDRLNSLNLPFFLPSSGIFTNYTWPKSYPALSAQYFLSLPTSLTSPSGRENPLTVSDIYIGIDTWGRNTHGGGGFACYRALNHISPSSSALSTALFGQAWTWETIQDDADFTWQKWWTNERKLWIGPLDEEWGEVVVPPAPRRGPEDPGCDCDYEPFCPVASFFPTRPPPDSAELALHTTFCPGVGWGWWVNGVKVFQALNSSESNGGWTDIDKQCSLGDLVWPKPNVEWEGMEFEGPLPGVVPDLCFDDAWNGGSSLRLTVTVAPDLSEGQELEGRGIFRNIWLPVQSLSVRRGCLYEGALVYKLIHDGEAHVEIGLSARTSSAKDTEGIQVSPIPYPDTDDLPGGWSKLSIQFTVPEPHSASDLSPPAKFLPAAIGVMVAMVAEEPLLEPSSIRLLLGQLNIYTAPPALAPEFKPKILWAHFIPSSPSEFVNPHTSKGDDPGLAGMLRWETAASFPPLDPTLIADIITSPEAPISALPLYHPGWFPGFVYFNVYALPYATVDGQDKVGQPEQAVWVGTSGVEGRRNVFGIPNGRLLFGKDSDNGNGNGEVNKKRKIRFYVQGVDEVGQVMKWEECAFVDCEL